MSSKKESKYLKVASLVWASKFVDGVRTDEFELDEDGQPTYRLLFSKDVPITIDGVDMTGKSLYVQSPLKNLEFLRVNGYINEDEYDKGVESHSEGGNKEFIRLEAKMKRV